MADEDPVAASRGPSPVGAGGPSRIARLAPGEIASRTFGRARNGISEPEVRDFLQRIAGEIVTAREYERELEDRIAQLEEQVRLASAADPAGEVAAAEARAAEILHEAEEAAREQGRAMVNEARAVRKRMLEDAEQRRATVEAELQTLGGLRADLRRACDALREALVALGAPEPKAAPARPHRPEAPRGAAAPAGEARSEPASRAASVFARLRGEEPPPEPEPEPEPESEPEAGSEPVPEAGAEPEPEPAAEAGAEPAPEAGAEPAPGADAEPEAVAEVLVEDVVAETTVVEVVVEDLEIAEEVDLPAGVAPADVTVTGDELTARRRARDEVVAPATEGLMRRAKRILQDDQNEFLDAMRRQKAKVDPDKLLPGLELQVAVWAEVLSPAVDAVYRAGRETVAPGTPSGGAPRRLVSDLAESLVVPLRERLSATVASVLDDGPYEPVSELHRALGAAVGARYREWRSQDLEPLVGDLLAAAYARGAFDAAPAGARLRWIAAEPDHCPDCDDNALETTVKGQPFPTGQAHPPAHPGCRCMVALG
ncbi:MAG TPA: DivIVA domain-containing protein [Acidimicrobiia bacterium]|nr:DivIVA domain-containing protein [Acidimicrobiia bacterium]